MLVHAHKDSSNTFNLPIHFAPYYLISLQNFRASNPGKDSRSSDKEELDIRNNQEMKETKEHKHPENDDIHIPDYDVSNVDAAFLAKVLEQVADMQPSTAFSP